MQRHTQTSTSHFKIKGEATLSKIHCKDPHDQHYLDFKGINRYYTKNRTKRDLRPNMENTIALFLTAQM